jgi:hypothetical protein
MQSYALALVCMVEGYEEAGVAGAEASPVPAIPVPVPVPVPAPGVFGDPGKNGDVPRSCSGVRGEARGLRGEEPPGDPAEPGDPGDLGTDASSGTAAAKRWPVRAGRERERQRRGGEAEGGVFLDSLFLGEAGGASRH